MLSFERIILDAKKYWKYTYLLLNGLIRILTNWVVEKLRKNCMNDLYDMNISSSLDLLSHNLGN